jgi:hypothetical protein
MTSSGREGSRYAAIDQCPFVETLGRYIGRIASVIGLTGVDDR